MTVTKGKCRSYFALPFLSLPYLTLTYLILRGQATYYRRDSQDEATA